jgi:hypothetical protein
VESSTLKEYGEEKAREHFIPNEEAKKKGKLPPFFAFFFSMVFFSLCLFIYLYSA